MVTNRDDFVIAIRSAFLKKGAQQRFSLISLILVSIFLLALEKVDFKYGYLFLAMNTKAINTFFHFKQERCKYKHESFF